MKLKVSIFLLTIFIYTYASMPVDWYYGQRLSNIDAISLSLGGVELFEPSVYCNNPLSKSSPISRLSLSYKVGILTERRTVQIYDQFDNTVGEVAIAENSFSRGNLGHFSLLIPFSVINLGINFRPQYSYDYYFYREYRDEFYTKIGETQLKTTGQVYNASVLLGNQFREKFGVGAGINYYFGARNYFFHDSILNGNFTTAETISKPSGIGFTAGFAIKPLERLLVNFIYQSSVKLDNFIDTIVTIKYPDIYKLNVSYLAAGEIPTKLGMLVQYSDWQTINHRFHRTFEISFGVEHTMLNSVALRYGFRYEPSFVGPVVHLGAVSLGWGFGIGDVKVDVSGEISRRVLYGENLIYADDNTLKIYQNTAKILLGARLPIDQLW